MVKKELLNSLSEENKKLYFEMVNELLFEQRNNVKSMKKANMIRDIKKD